jgi:tripartite-type tricarboxylate transporter receptor subunit TctC
VPIALLESSPIVLVASPTVAASSAPELIDLARAKPGVLSYASNGNGSPEQVAGELFKKRLQLEIRHLPYDGAGPARKAVLAGQAELMFDPCKGALPAIRKGLQRPLAVAAPTRLSGLPNVPTFGELGVPNYELRIWTGVLAPAGTPKEIVTKLDRAIQAMLRTPEVQREIADEGGEAGVSTPKQLRCSCKLSVNVGVRSSLKVESRKCCSDDERYTVLSISRHWICGEITEITSKLARCERSSREFL